MLILSCRDSDGNKTLEHGVSGGFSDFGNSFLALKFSGYVILQEKKHITGHSNLYTAQDGNRDSRT